MDSADSGSLDDSASTVDLGLRKSNGGSSSEKPVFIDNYLIEHELGHGGMGEVYLATEQGLNRQVALKVLQAANRISSKQVKRFLLEAQAAAQLSHDHIVPIYHVGEYHGIHYFTMRYIEGHDLSVIIRNGQRALREMSHGSIDTQVASEFKNKSKTNKSGDSTVKDRADSTNGLIDLSADSFVGSQRSSRSRSAHRLAISVALIGQAVAEALQHAHEHGIVHRDIKPSNLMLDHTNKIWVTDFGLAQLQNAEGLTNTGDILGTLRYMSPEQATGQKAFIDHRTDIYSLGVTLYELATLQKACRGESAQEILRSITFERPQPIRKVNPKLPRDLETIICKATERNPSERYQTAAEMARDLERFANSQSLMTRRPSRLKALRNWVWDRPGISAMALAMLLVFAGSMMVVAWAKNGEFVAEKLRADEAEKSLSVSQGQQLLSQAMLWKDVNPGLGIAAALEGAEAAPGLTAQRALMASVDANHELRAIRVKFDVPGKCVSSHDGKQLVICRGTTSPIRSKQAAMVLNIATGTELGQLESDLGISDAAFSPDDRYLLTLSLTTSVTDKSEKPTTTLIVWDATTRQILKTFPQNFCTRISSACFHPTQPQLILPNSQRSATLYDTNTFDPLLVLPTSHELPVLESKFSQDGARLITWSEEKKAIVWDAETGAKVRLVEYGCTNPSATEIFVTSDSRELCISGDAGTRIVSMIDEASEFFRPEQIACVSPRVPLIYFYSIGRSSLLIVDATSKRVLKECQNEGRITEAIVLANDEYLAAISDERVHVFETQSGRLTAKLRGHRDFVESLAAMPEAGRLASLGWDGTVRLWDVLTDLERRTLPLQIEKGNVPVLGQSLDGRNVVLGSIRAHATTLRSFEKPNEVQAAVPGDAILLLADGRLLTSSDGTAALWDLKTQRRVQEVFISTTLKNPIRLAEELKELETVAMITRENRLVIWNLRTNNLAQPAQVSGNVYAMAWNPQNGTLLFGVSTGELCVLNPKSYEVTEIARFAKSIRELDLHTKKNEVLVSCADGSAHVLDLSTREKLTKFSREGVGIAEAFFVADDKVLTVGGETGAALWDVGTQEVLDRLAIGQVFELDFTSDRSAVALASAKGVVYWDFRNKSHRSATVDESRAVAFVGSRIAYAKESADGSSSEVVVWNPIDQTNEATFSVDQWISRIYAGDLQDHFVLSTFAFGAEVVDVPRNKSLGRFLEHRQPLILADFTALPDQLVTLSGDGTLKLYRLRGGEVIEPVASPVTVTAAAMSQDRRLLFVADRTGRLSQWDLSSLEAKEIVPVNDQAITRLLLNAASNMVVTVVGDKTLRYWDLRTSKDYSFKIEKGIRDVALSPDGRFILVVMGRNAYHPAHPVFTAEAIQQGAQYGLSLIDVQTGEQKQIPSEGIPISVHFVDSGKGLAVLSTLGKLQVFDTAELKLQTGPTSSRRLMKSLSGEANAPWVIAAAKERVGGWDWRDGSTVFELNTELSEDETANLTPSVFLTNRASDSYVILTSPGRFTKQPVNPQEYAKKIAPYQLTEEERSQLLKGQDR